MSIASAISALQSASSDIATAIATKGVTVPSGSGYDDYAELINGIRTDGLNDWLKDGDTHLWIDIVSEEQLSQTLRIRIVGTIDWGDGTTETLNMSSIASRTHTYSSVGKYRIDLKPTGTLTLSPASSTYCIMGGVTNRFRTSVLYQAEIGTKQVTVISGYTFYNCVGLKKVYVPKTITSISLYAFSYAVSLTEIEFEDTDTLTGTASSNIFAYCFSIRFNPFYSMNLTSLSATFRSNYCLREVTIPPLVTSIAANTFANCYSLARMYCIPTIAPTVAAESAFTSIPSSCSIKVPFGSLSSYQSAQYWSAFSSQMVEAGAITRTLTNVRSSNKVLMVDANSAYETTLTADDGYTIGTVTVKMGGTDITSTVYSNGEVNIASVTGNITITASAS